MAYLRPLRIVMTAAHGGSCSEKVPLGGAAAICERLLRYWQGRDDIEVTLLAPGRQAPQKAANIHYEQIDLLQGRAPSSLNELAYAKFCRQFENAQNQYILQNRPDAVLCHDISEGPSFALLNRYGIKCLPIYHVDVVDYFCRIYLNEWVTPMKAEAFMQKWRPYPVIPDLLRLVFDKQAETMQFCPRIIVPSAGMKTVMRKTYANQDDRLEKKIVVVPWGAPPLAEQQLFSEVQISERAQTLANHLGITPNERVIVTLSRISPEKGQDRLLEAARQAEEQGVSFAGIVLVICGEAAYMMGKNYWLKLQRLATKLKSLRVIFPGHLGGLDKQAILQRADIFVSPSRHESYGLTTMEAMNRHCACCATATPGSLETLGHCGVLIKEGPHNGQELIATICRLATNPQECQALATAAREQAQLNPFDNAAQLITELLRQQAS